jgi:hypothetical protein
VFSAGILSFCQVTMAHETETPSADPMPKGYDESFHTGDIPKPNTPELNPDMVNEDELNPDQNPDKNPLSDPGRDRVPEDFMIGATAALTFPHLLNLGLDTLIYHRFGVSLNYGNVTKSINSIDVAMKHTDVRLRWFPWESSFFVGAAVGQHQLSGEADRQVSEPTTKQKYATHGKLVAKANYIAPHFGWFSVWDSGFTLGCDFGYLVPSSPKATFTSSFANAPAGSEDTLKDTAEYKKMKSDLEDSAKSYAGKKLPFASFLRIGWMF